jgi:cell division septum initiation protein DivIVA
MDRQAELMATIAELERRPAPVIETLDERRVTALLGAETARVLDAAREAAAGIKATAEEQAAQVLGAAEAVAEELRARADGVLGQRTAEAEAEASRIRGEAQAEAERVLTDGRAEAERLRCEARAEAERLEAEARAAADRLGSEATEEAERLRSDAASEAARVRAESTSEAERVRAEATSEAERLSSEAKAEADRLTSEAHALQHQAAEDSTELLDRSREDGRRMVAEARAVRERILTDMARRRNQARQQLEKLRAGRERLIDAVEAVRKVVEETSGELSTSLVEARLAGERAARQVDVDTIPPMNELDAEVELAKDAGLVDRDAIARAVSAEPIDVRPTGGDALAASAPTDMLKQVDGGAETVLDELEHLGVDEFDEDPTAGAAGSTAEPIETPGSPRPSEATTATGSTDTDTGAAPQRKAGFSVKVEDLFRSWKEGDEPAAEESPVGVRPATSGDDASDQPGTGQGSAAGAGGAKATDEKAGDLQATDSQVGVVTATPEEKPAEQGARPSSSKGSRRSKARDTGRRTARGATPPKGATKTDEAASPSEGSVSLESGLEADPVTAAHNPVTVADSEALAETTAPAGGAAAAETDEEEPTVPATADQVALHTRDAVLAGTARDLGRQLKLALSDEQNMILERIRAGSIDEAPTAVELAEPYRTVARRELMPALEAGWRSVVDRNPAIVGAVDHDLLDRVVDDLVAALTDPVRDRLESVLRDVDDPAERVRNLFRETRNQRVIGLAEHSTLAAFGEGQLAASRQAPEELPVRWVFEDCTPDCLDNSLAGEVPPGEAFPTGHFHPPAFVGCRCLLAVGRTRAEPRDHIARPAV